MLDLTKPQELMPKDLLQFVEKNAERAIEVLREIIDLPEASAHELSQFQAFSPNGAANAINSTNATITGWGTGTAGLGLAQTILPQAPFNSQAGI